MRPTIKAIGMLMLLAPFRTCGKSCGLLGWASWIWEAHSFWSWKTIHADWNKTWKTEGKKTWIEKFWQCETHEKRRNSADSSRAFSHVKLSMSIRFWEQLRILLLKNAEVTLNYLGAKIPGWVVWSQTTKPGGRTLANSAFRPLKCFENLRHKHFFWRGLQMYKSWQINSRPW